MNYDKYLARTTTPLKKSSAKSGGRFFWFFLFYLNGITGFAQFYQTGVDNGKIRWRHIQTREFQLVYPNYYEQQAQRFANVLDTLHDKIGVSLLTPVPKIPFLLHTESCYSNGVTVWAPKRIELWTTPPQTGYAYPWMWQLAIHEWRHAVQVESINVGATFWLQQLFGEHIMGLMLALFVPRWFMEGDAVLTETLLAPTGRGNTPAFSQGLRAQLVEKGAYPFVKANLGSYKDHVPNEYVLGYHLVRHGRWASNPYVWGRVMNNVGENFWQITPFNKGLKKYSGMSLETLYGEMVDSLLCVYRSCDSLFTPNAHAVQLSPKRKNYTSYLSPVAWQNTQAVSLKYSYDSYPEVVLLDSLDEEVLFAPGHPLNGYISLHSSGKIIWSHFARHPRWHHEGYAELMEFDLPTRKTRAITKGGRFFSATYHPTDVYAVAAVTEDSLSRQFLVVLDTRTGHSTTQIGDTLPEIRFSSPVWDENGKYIYAIKTSPQGENVVKWDIAKHTLENLTPASYFTLSSLRHAQNHLYFVADYEGKNGIYRLSSEVPKNIERVVNPRFGIESFTIADHQILYNDYTADGYRLLRVPLDEQQCVPIPIPKNNKDTVLQQLSQQENFLLTEDKLLHNTFESQSYLKLPHLFHIHSWLYPISLNTIDQSIQPGVSIYSQNLLGTSVFQGGWQYNTEEQRSGFFANYHYTGFYPALSVNSSYAYRKLFDKQKVDTPFSNFWEWEEVVLDGTMALPLQWAPSNWHRRLTLTASGNFRKLFERKQTTLTVNAVHSLRIGATYANVQNKASKSLFPRWGQQIDLSYQKAFTEQNPDLFSLNVLNICPGVAPHHAFWVQAGFQKNSPEVYYYPNRISFPSGVYNYAPERLYSFKTAYYFPLGYPDWHLSSAIYVKRIYLGGFYDFGFFDGLFMDSFGGEFQTDCHLLNMELPLRLGFRLGYNLKERDVFFDFSHHIDL